VVVVRLWMGSCAYHGVVTIALSASLLWDLVPSVSWRKSFVNNLKGLYVSSDFLLVLISSKML
jgi:hypothetical protein